MIKSTLIAMLVIVPSIASAYKAKPVTTCELARASNRAAKNWAIKPKPASEKQYPIWVNASPWCSWADGNAKNHKLIMHHSSSGAPQSVAIYKLGAQEWMRDEIGKLSNMCGIPRNFTKRKLPYTSGKPGRKCWADIRMGPYTLYIHQWAVAKPGSKRHTKSMKPLNFGFLKSNSRRR